MALYEYQCENCGEVFELIQKFSDQPLVTHEKCGGPVHRLISAPALQFKGTGWYVTDYAKGGSSSEKSANSADNGGSKKTDKADSGSSTSDSGSTAKADGGSSGESKSSSSEKSSSDKGSTEKK